MGFGGEASDGEGWAKGEEYVVAWEIPGWLSHFAGQVSMTCRTKAHSLLYSSRGNLHNFVLSLFQLGSSDAAPPLALQPFFVLLHTPDKGTFHPDLMSVFVKD